MKCIALLATCLAAVLAGEARKWDFEDGAVGELPKGWTATRTGDGAGSIWQVLEDKTAPNGPKVLAQVSLEGAKSSFNVCVADDTKYADVDLQVSMKPVRGKTDQGGGLVWRYQDAKNYYVARMNPLEWNYRLYKVIDGGRVQLATADVDADESDDDDSLRGKWHKLRVVHRGAEIRCYLNGKLKLQFKDETIKAAGKIGLWTKADAVTWFDKLICEVPGEDEK